MPATGGARDKVKVLWYPRQKLSSTARIVLKTGPLPVWGQHTTTFEFALWLLHSTVRFLNQGGKAPWGVVWVLVGKHGTQFAQDQHHELPWSGRASRHHHNNQLLSMVRMHGVIHCYGDGGQLTLHHGDTMIQGRCHARPPPFIEEKMEDRLLQTSFTSCPLMCC